jgi:large subunit ribosomal protein L25
MKTFDLEGQLRQEVGKKSAKIARVADNVPCVLYGNNGNVHFTVTQSAVRKLIYTPEVFIVNLTVEGKDRKAIVKELQFHPVKDTLMHIDFLEITDKKAVAIDIPVKLEGLAAGVKAGGKLSLQLRKLRVKGIYTDFPESITLDVTKLVLGKSIQVGEIQLDKLEILSPKNAVVCQVKLTRAARAADEEEAGVEEGEEGETSEE